MSFSPVSQRSQNRRPKKGQKQPEGERDYACIHSFQLPTCANAEEPKQEAQEGAEATEGEGEATEKEEAAHISILDNKCLHLCFAEEPTKEAEPTTEEGAIEGEATEKTEAAPEKEEEVAGPEPSRVNSAQSIARMLLQDGLLLLELQVCVSCLCVDVDVCLCVYGCK